MLPYRGLVKSDPLNYRYRMTEFLLQTGRSSNMHIHIPDAVPALEGLRLWLSRGRELRSELLERRSALQAELEQIEVALRALDFKEEGEEDEPAVRKRNVLDMTKEGVLRVVRAKPEVISRDIAADLGAKTPKRKHQIQVALRELVAQKALKRNGTRGSYTYSIMNR